MLRYVYSPLICPVECSYETVSHDAGMLHTLKNGYQLLSTSANLIRPSTIHSVRFLHGLGYLSTGTVHQALFMRVYMQLIAHELD